MHARRPFGQRPVVPGLSVQGLQYAIQAGAAGIGQKAGLGRGQAQLIDQHLSQAAVGFILGNLHVAPGKVAEDGLENLTDHQRAGLRR
ncbi:hypothetical protein D3C84_950020 [compost metagenome]